MNNVENFVKYNSKVVCRYMPKAKRNDAQMLDLSLLREYFKCEGLEYKHYDKKIKLYVLSARALDATMDPLIEYPQSNKTIVFKNDGTIECDCACSFDGAKHYLLYGMVFVKKIYKGTITFLPQSDWMYRMDYLQVELSYYFFLKKPRININRLHKYLLSLRDDVPYIFVHQHSHILIRLKSDQDIMVFGLKSDQDIMVFEDCLKTKKMYGTGDNAADQKKFNDVFCTLDKFIPLFRSMHRSYKLIKKK